MIPKQLFARVRMAPEINDNAAVKYSNYQLIAALNSVLSIVYNTVASSSSSILNVVETVRMRNGRGELPEDFLQAVMITSGGRTLTPQTKSNDVDQYTYKIRGNYIYSANDVIEIEYKPYFDDVTYDAIDDDLEIPKYFQELIRKYMVIVLVGGVPNADASIVTMIQSDVMNLTAGREYTALIAGSKPAWKV